MTRARGRYGDAGRRRARGVLRRLEFDPLEPRLAPASLAIGDATIVEGDSGTSFVALTVTLSNPHPSRTVTVSYATADGTAAAGSDYVAKSGTLTLSNSQRTAQVRVEVEGDVLDEAAETVRVLLSNPQNASIDDGEGLATIDDDDPAPALSIADVARVEGNAGPAVAQFVVSLSAPSGLPVSVRATTADGTAAVGADYASNNVLVTIGPGSTSATFDVPINGDTTFEADETFLVNLTQPTNATIADPQAVGTIANDDPQPTVLVRDVTMIEGDSGTVGASFSVLLSDASAIAVTVTYSTADGTAAAGADYTAASGTLTFAPGETAKTVVVPILGDLLDEDDEAFTLALTGATGAAIDDGTGLGSILDNDPLPLLSISDATAVEGDSGTVNLVFTVTLSPASGRSVQVAYATGSASATPGSDFTATSGTLTFAPGETTKTIAVPVPGDLLDEDDEAFTLTLSGPAGATIGDGSGTGSIVDNDPMPSLSIDDLVVVEADAGTMLRTVVIRLSAPSGRPVTVNYATADGTATAPGDYTASTGTAAFAPGTTVVNQAITIAGDTAFEPGETFVVNLSGATNATIADGQAVVTIQNNDQPPQPTLSISDATVTEGDSGTVDAVFTISLSQAATQPVRVYYSTSAGTATAGADYTHTVNAVDFQAGEIAKTVSIPVLGDLLDEDNEAFFVTLNGQSGAPIGDGSGLGRINDNDPLPAVSIGDATVVEGNGGTTAATFTVTVSPASGRVVVIQYATRDFSALASDGDYVAASGQVTFLPGETSKTITIAVHGDARVESEEDFYVDITSAFNATVSKFRGVGRIVDDDVALFVMVSDAAPVTEGDSGSVDTTFTVYLTRPNASPITVTYTTLSSVAAPGEDYILASGTLTFAPGETSKTVVVPVLGDTLDEDDELYVLSVTSAAGAPLGRYNGGGKILDDDPTPTLSIGDAVGPEAGPAASVVVSLSAPSGRTVTVEYWTSDGTATEGADYTAASGLVTFQPGVTSMTIDLGAIDDGVKEPDESFFISIGNPWNATIADGTGERTIANDDFSQIRGTLYEDRNANGARDAGEGVLAGRTAYVDLDRDGRPDPGEPTSVSDADGGYLFLGLPPGTYEVRQVLPDGWKASAPGPLDGFTDNWFSLANHRDLVYDAARQTLYATTGDGKVQRYHVPTRTVLPAWNVGVSLFGADITPDGRYLYVSEGQPAGNAGLLHKVDLDDGSVSLLAFPFINGYIAGSFDVRIGPDGKGLIDSVYFREIDTATDTITARANTPGAPYTSRINMTRGADRSVFLMADTGDDAGRFFTYDPAAATFGAEDESDALLGSSQIGVNRDGSLLAMEIDGGISVFDRSNRAVAVLSYDGGFAFDPRGDVLYAIDSSGSIFTDALVAIETGTWQVLARIPLNENLPDSSVFGPGEMEIGDDGTLFLSTTYGVRWFTLPTRGAQRVTLADGQQVSGKDFLSYSADPGSLPSLAVNDPSIVEGNDGTQLRDIVFTVSLSSAGTRTVTVDYRVVPGSATVEDNDYSSSSVFAGTLTFSPGQLSKVVTLKVRGDTKDELDETFLLRLSNPSGATIADPQGVATILNDDAGTRGSIAGTAYEDADRNGFRSAGEAALAGATVYLDQNANGRLDAWEPSTVAGPDGSYGFANLPGGTYYVAWVVPAGYESTQATSALVRGTAVGLVSMPDRRDVVFDPTRNLLYITTAHGAVERYDLATGRLLSPIPVGSSLRAADITPDGRYLYVAEGQRGTTQGLIYKVGLDDGSVTPLRYDLTRDEGGAFDLAVGRDGVVLFSATFEGSGSTPVRRIDPVTGVISQVLGSTQDGLVARGADRGSFYLTQGNISSGTISTYDVDSGSFPLSFGTGDYLSRSVGAVNRTGGLFAVEHGLSTVGVNIYDRNLRLVASPAIGTGGMVFDPVRDLLYASDGVNLRAWDSNSWTSRVIGQYDEQSGGSEPFNNGEMAVTPDGGTLFITTPSGVRIVHIDHDVRVVTTFGDAMSGVNLGAARPSAPTVSIDDVTGTEGFSASAHVFSVTLSRPSATPVTVSFTTADGTARAGSDYTAKSGTITFAPGETGRTIVVPVLVDSLDEPTETFTVTLTGASGAAIARAQGLGTIGDDDLPATLRITGVTVTEGDSGTTDAVFTVSILNSGGSGFTVTVKYATADTVGTAGKATPGLDYTATSGTLTFAPGETSKTIAVPVIGDALSEFTELFNVVLSNPVNASVSDSNGVAPGTINDNDPVPGLSVDDAAVAEGDAATVIVTLSAPSGRTVTVDYRTADGAAVEGRDYVAASGRLTFAPGETSKTIVLQTIEDAVSEAGESFFLDLFTASNATIGRGRGTRKVVDDDYPDDSPTSEDEQDDGGIGTPDDPRDRPRRDPKLGRGRDPVDRPPDPPRRGLLPIGTDANRPGVETFGVTALDVTIVDPGGSILVTLAGPRARGRREVRSRP